VKTLNPSLRKLPVLQELHRQWFANRGAATVNEYDRPFSRKWEDLLQDAGLNSAEERREADRDARTLAEAGIIVIKASRQRRQVIDRVAIPLEIEPALRALFPEFEASSKSPFEWETVAWEAELSFVPEVRPLVALADLQSMNEFFRTGGRERPMVPIKERSLQLFGDEKRLDALRESALFQPGRLSLELLRCEIVGEPFGWKRGPRDTGVTLVIENAATWHSYSRWNEQRQLFSAVVYGCGNRFADSTRYLRDILAELAAPQRVLYFGDLDPQGLRIPIEATAKALRMGMPPVEPDFWSYQHLLRLGQGRETNSGSVEPVTEDAAAWIGHLAENVRPLFGGGKRLAQELVGWEFLRSHDNGESNWYPK